MIRCRVSSDMRADPPCSAPDTVLTETPARMAMSLSEAVTGSLWVIDYPIGYRSFCPESSWDGVAERKMPVPGALTERSGQFNQNSCDVRR
ncbi:hypothetical protein RHECNPAF_14110036 [Rhizobium etli CNPAF512]|nr:hypothetical protein RHECNPAF_14110036 [Rhizobium etli CNPAF512]